MKLLELTCESSETVKKYPQSPHQSQQLKQINRVQIESISKARNLNNSSERIPTVRDFLVGRIGLEESPRREVISYEKTKEIKKEENLLQD
jgi:hypothetical protein